MVKFIPSTFEDCDLIKSWIDADPWHQEFKDDPNWWITKDAYLTFKLVDYEGTVLFCRMDHERKPRLRLHTQFGPVSQVSERRTAIAIIQGFAQFMPHAQANGISQIVTESVSPKLIEFLCSEKVGFKHEAKDDYVLTFEG